MGRVEKRGIYLRWLLSKLMERQKKRWTKSVKLMTKDRPNMKGLLFLARQTGRTGRMVRTDGRIYAFFQFHVFVCVNVCEWKNRIHMNHKPRRNHEKASEKPHSTHAEATQMLRKQKLSKNHTKSMQKNHVEIIQRSHKCRI